MIDLKAAKYCYTCDKTGILTSRRGSRPCPYCQQHLYEKSKLEFMYAVAAPVTAEKEQIGGVEQPPMGMGCLLETPDLGPQKNRLRNLSPCMCGHFAPLRGYGANEEGTVNVYVCSNCSRDFKEYAG